MVWVRKVEQLCLVSIDEVEDQVDSVFRCSVGGDLPVARPAGPAPTISTSYTISFVSIFQNAKSKSSFLPVFSIVMFCGIVEYANISVAMALNVEL